MGVRINFQEVKIPLAVLAECIVAAHHKGLHADAADQDVLEERLGGNRCEVQGEGDADENVNARSFNEFDLLLVKRDQRRMAVLMENPDGMGFECHRDGSAVDLRGFFDDFVEKGPGAPGGPRQNFRW